MTSTLPDVRACALFLYTAALPAQVAIPFPLEPSQEVGSGSVGSGGTFADIDRDGWPDLVIAAGDDLLRHRVQVFYNRKDGTFPTTADWSSADIDYHANLDVGDVNGDGWPDVAVSVFLGPAMFSEKGYVKLYLNDGKGKLSSTPSWRSGDTCFTYGCAFGDVDGDGDLDLVVATGEYYSNPPDYDRIYYNNGGALDPLPRWKSAVTSYSMGVAIADIDGDGDLDIGFAGTHGPNLVYLAAGAKIPTTPSWSSTDGGVRHNAIHCVFADIDGDGRRDFVTASNAQRRGRGTFRVYQNTGSSFTATPWWESALYFNGRTSAITVLDFDLDGDLDLCGSAWWSKTSWFQNAQGTLPLTPTWTATRSDVVGHLFVGDVNRDGLRVVTGETYTLGGGRQLFYLRKRPVESLERIVADGVPLGPHQFAFHKDGGWISLQSAPVRSLSVDYTYTEAADLGASIWDVNKGNYIFIRDPLAKLELQPPTQTAFRGGQVVSWSESVELTSASAQPVVYRQTLELPNNLGVLRLWDVATRIQGPQNIGPITWNLALPPGLPANFAGTYRIRTELLTPQRTVMSSAVFVFTFNP